MNQLYTVLKKIILALSIVLSSFCSFAQTGLGPLNWTEPINVESNSIFIIWMDNAGYSNSNIYQKVYGFDYNNQIQSTDSAITKTLKMEDDRTGGGAYVDVAKGKFNVGPRDQVVSVWGGDVFGNSMINIMIPQFDTSATMWTNSIQDSIVSDVQNDRIYVKTLDIDGDSLDEYLVSFLDIQDSIHFYLYDVDSTFQSTLIATFSDEKVVSDFSYQFVRYSIETADFNGDGTEELALIYVDSPLSSVLFEVKIKVYDFDNDSFISQGEDEFLIPYNNPLQEFVMASAEGNFNENNKRELVVSSVRKGNGYWNSYHYLFEFSSNLQSISQSDIYLNYAIDPEGNFQHTSIVSGDLNDDGLDEIIFTTQETVYIMSTEGDLSLSLENEFDVTSGGSYEIQQKHNFLELSDINQDGRKEIVIIKDFVDNNQQEDGFYVGMYSIDTSFVETLIGELVGDEQLLVDIDNPEYEYRPYAIAIGNFDGYNFTIGEPTNYIVSEVAQPTVILNAPPIHFDQFDDENFDVNDCYNGEECDFYARYTKVSNSTIEVTTTVQADWAISAGLSMSGSVSVGATVTVAPLGVGGSVNTSLSVNYENHLLYTQGAHFSNTSVSSYTQTISYENTAIEDDRIYSTVSDFEVWEYPVYHGNETFPRNTIATFVPVGVESTWFPSKSYSASSYIPEHEVSNILSYRPYPEINDNPNVDQGIDVDNTVSYVLTALSEDDWSTSSEDFSSSSADTIREYGLDVGVSMGIIRFDGDYNNKTINTNKTSVTNLIQLDVHLGGLDMSIGDVKYAVTPYSYWSKDGALVVDYAARPEIAPPGNPETWWTEKYGSYPDPTFILPWRLDPEKGFAISEEAKREQTKDIQFSPSNPLEGDTADIKVRVRNFSLLSTTESVSVSFYLGDPDGNGTPIIGLNGSNTVDTEGTIENRESEDVVLRWVIPENMSSYPRIYAVLDEDGFIEEVHEGNNKGFNVMDYPFGSPTGIDDILSATNNDYFSSAYPNPFTSFTTIEYTLKDNNETRIVVYDQLGNKVKTLIDKYQSAGNHSVSFNGTGLASGIYFYTIQCGAISETKKLVLLE